MAGWWSRTWRRLFWRAPRKSQGPGLRGIPAPATLVARVEASTDLDRGIIRLAEESLRRGYPDQAEIAYAKAASHYRAQGLFRKEVAVLEVLARLRPDDPDVFERLGAALEQMSRRADAAIALRAAAERRRRDGEEEIARALVVRARELQLREVDELAPRDRPASTMPTGEVPPEPPPESLASALEDDDDLDDVNSLVMKALCDEGYEIPGELLAEIESASRSVEAPSMPGAAVPTASHPTLDRDAPIRVERDAAHRLELDDPTRETDPFEEETPIDDGLATEPPRRPPRPAIPDLKTTNDPALSAAMREEVERLAAEAPSTDDPTTEDAGATRVAPNAEVARLLEKIRKKP